MLRDYGAENMAGARRTRSKHQHINTELEHSRECGKEATAATVHTEALTQDARAARAA